MLELRPDAVVADETLVAAVYGSTLTMALALASSAVPGCWLGCAASPPMFMVNDERV